MMSVLDRLQENFGAGIVGCSENHGMVVIVVDRRRVYDILKFLKADPHLKFELFLDVCGVDYFGQNPRFELVYHLYSFKLNARVRVKIKLREDDLKVPSVVDVWPAADWFEREAYDMFGFVFENHPHLKRILTWDEFEGHALRKDYPARRRQPIPTLKDVILP